jgi:hypothetical protein
MAALGWTVAAMLKAAATNKITIKQEVGFFTRLRLRKTLFPAAHSINARTIGTRSVRSLVA